MPGKCVRPEIELGLRKKCYPLLTLTLKTAPDLKPRVSLWVSDTTRGHKCSLSLLNGEEKVQDGRQIKQWEPLRIKWEAEKERAKGCWLQAVIKIKHT